MIINEVQNKFDERFVRMWDLYLSACAATFHNGIIDLHQILFTAGINNFFMLHLSESFDHGCRKAAVVQFMRYFLRGKPGGIGQFLCI